MASRLVQQPINNHTSEEEVQHVQEWTEENNLRLNPNKCNEITFHLYRAKARKSKQLPPLCLDIERVQQVTVLGVILNDRLSASDHITYLITSCVQLMYTLRILRAHGLPQQSLNDVYQATVQGKFLYAASTWFGFCTAGGKVRLNSFFRRGWKLGYSDSNITFEDMCADADEQLFNRLIHNLNHTPQTVTTTHNSVSTIQS